MKIFSKKISLIGISLLIAAAAVYALEVGGVLSNVTIKNTAKASASIPGLGSKVVTIFYTDVDVKDVNDALSNAIKAKNYPKDKYQGVGIANTKDTWKPDYFITSAAAKKQAAFPDSVILLDYDHVCKTAWSLGNCDQVAVVIVVGKDKKVKLIKKVSAPGESTALIPVVIPLIEAEMKK